MSTTISYENENNKAITKQQALQSKNYIQITKKNDSIKIIEEFSEGKLIDFSFYQENESINEILDLYPNIIRFNIRKIVQNQGNYVKEEENVFKRNEGLKLSGFTIKNILNGKTLCFGDIDIQTGNIIPESVIKLQYNTYGDLAYYYHYNEQGKIDYIEEVDSKGIYANEFSMDYYNNALQLFP